jgi:hypothetical protein
VRLSRTFLDDVECASKENGCCILTELEK